MTKKVANQVHGKSPRKPKSVNAMTPNKEPRRSQEYPHNELERCEIDILSAHIVRKDVGVVAGIKEDALSAIFNECRKAPILLHR